MTDVQVGTDLGAAGDPAQTSNANVMRKIGNKREQKPQQPQPQKQAKPQQAPKQPAAAGPGHEGDIPKVTPQEAQQGQAQFQKEWNQRPLQSQNPLVNFIEGFPDAGWLGYQGARYVMNGMQATQFDQVSRYTQSVQNMWEQQSAAAEIQKAMLTTAAWSPPGLLLRGLYNEVYAGGHAKVSSDPNEAAVQQMTGGAIGLALDPTAWGIVATGGMDSPAGMVGAKVVGPGGEDAAKAAETAAAKAGAEQAPKAAEQPAAAQSVVSKVAQQAGANELRAAPHQAGNLAYNVANDPNLTPQSFLWDLMLAIVFSNGQLTPAARAMLKKMGPVADRVGTTLADRYAKSLADTLQRDGNISVPEYMDEVMRDLVERGAKQPTESLVRKQTDRTIEGTIDESGQMAVSTNKKQRQVLADMGIDSMDQLEEALQTGSLTSSQMKQVESQWKYLGLPYEMVRVGEGERDLVNPADHMGDIGKENAGAAHDAMTFLRMFVDHSYRSPMANDSRPLVSLWRALIGYNRATDWLHPKLMQSWVRLLGEADSKSRSVQEALTKAVEGDEKVYESLTPEQKMVADSWRVAAAALRRRSRETGYAHDFVPNYFPRSPVDREGVNIHYGGSDDPLKGERRKHRVEQMILAETSDGLKRLELRQRYASVFSLNADQAAIRRRLMEGDDETPGLTEAQAYAQHPDFETNFLKAANKSLGRQMAAIHSHTAMQSLLDTIVKDAKGQQVSAAVSTEGLDNFAVQDLRNQGYVFPDSHYFRNVMVQQDFNKLLKRGSRAANEKLSDRSAMMKALLKVEGAAIESIMYSPMIHGMNMAGRLGMAWTMYPVAMTKYMLKGSQSDRLKNILSDELKGGDDVMFHRMQQTRAGVLPHSKWRNFAVEQYGAQADATGDHAIGEHPGIGQTDHIPQWIQKTMPDQLNGLAHKVGSGYDYLNNMLWSNVGDFGGMMYQIELASFERAGMKPEEASLLAARRANSWMGKVAPEDSNPILHELARTIFFAPNWIRTWAELLTGIYRDAGFGWDQKTVAIHAVNEARTFAAMLGFQKVSGNVFNLAMSGKPQWMNQPENQDRVEISNPLVIRMMQSLGMAQGIDPSTGENPKTGAVLTVENPLARQQLMIEEMAGLESGQKGWSPANVSPGIRTAMAGRVSPLLNAATSAANVDLYNSIVSGQVKKLNPTEDLGPHGDDLLMGLAQLMPLGYQAQTAIQQGEGVYGTTTPPGVKTALTGLGQSTLQQMLTGLTGVNPPVSRGQKTAGQALTDQAYASIQSIDNTYDNQMGKLQNELIAGDITPDQWRTEYENLTIQRAVTLQSYYNSSAEYTGGTDGLVAQWEELYTRPEVQNADGTINEDALLLLQQNFTADHTQAQMNALNSALTKTQQKYPAVKAYKDAVNSYYAFQAQWARDNGVNLYKLMNESKEFGQLYGTTAMYQYEGEHPDLVAWEVAKRTWLRSPAGINYGLYEGSSTAIRAAETIGLGTGTYSAAAVSKNPNIAAQGKLDEQILNEYEQQLMSAGVSPANAQSAAEQIVSSNP